MNPLKTIDSRAGLPDRLTYEMIKFGTHTGRAFLLSDRGHEKKYGYRHGVSTPIGDIEENLWYELMRELILQNDEVDLYEQLLEWYRDDPVAGSTKKEREQYALMCFSYRLFDSLDWVDYIPFNQKNRSEILGEWMA